MQKPQFVTSTNSQSHHDFFKLKIKYVIPNMHFVYIRSLVRLQSLTTQTLMLINGILKKTTEKVRSSMT